MSRIHFNSNMTKSVFWGLFLLMFTNCHQIKVLEIKNTTNDAYWQEGALPVISHSTEDGADAEIFTHQKLQVVEGFGGCFNELGWEQLVTLSEKERGQILYDLFDQQDGCKFNLCRMPIGANDYAVDWYSHNEYDGDLAMKHFSIDRDRQRLIPYIQAVQKIAPDLKIWASPWCPPSWMKTNHHYACSPGAVNDLEPEGAGKEMETQFRMEPEMLEAYALYFSKFVQAYEQEGIPVTAVHVQNEPNSCQVFPSCVWRPEDLAFFIGKYLGPRFKKDSLATDIFLGTVERPQIERVSAVLDDPEAQKYVRGVGFQWAGKGAIPDVQQRYPEMRLIQSETECGNGSNDWAAAEHTWNLIHHYFNHGANAYMYWNMVLDETGKSQWGWKQNSMITVDNTSGTITYNPEFYLMKHLSYFIKPGAVKLATSGEFDQLLAFENLDGEVIVVTYNNSPESKELKLKIENQMVISEMPPYSFNTCKMRL